MQKHSKKHRNSRQFQAIANTSYQPVRPVQAEPQPERKRRRFTWKKALLLLFVLLLTPLLVIAIWDYRNFAGASQKMFGTSNVLGLMPTALDSTAQDRVNILLIGYSVDDPDHAGAMLTDSILVVSLDKTDHTGYMLSLPRDLYVNIPDYGRAKINEAYQAGEHMGYRKADRPSGGAGLLEEVITDHLGIELHYYAVINYTAVRQITDALGGITVNVESPDPRGLYDPNFEPDEGGPLQLPNGPQKIDGVTALKLTRARGAEGGYGFPLSDFNRTQNQQKVFAAIKQELSWTLVLDPRKNSQIFQAVGDNVKTDVELSEVIPLYRLFTSVPSDQLKPVTLRDINGQNLLKGYRTPNGQSALIPAEGVGNFEQIQAAITSLD